MQSSNPPSFFSLFLAATLLLLVWSGSAATLQTPTLPSPWEVFLALKGGALSFYLPHLWASSQRVLGSLALSLLFAVPLGISIGRYPSLEALASPLLYLLYPLPKSVFMPIFLLLFGMGEGSKMALMVWIVGFQILINMRDAVKEISPQHIEMVQLLGGGEASVWKHTLLPACLPRLFTTLRMSLATAMAVLFLTETYATQVGMGAAILDGLARFNYKEVFVGVLLFSSFGALLFTLIDRAEKKLTPWRFAP